MPSSVTRMVSEWRAGYLEIRSHRHGGDGQPRRRYLPRAGPTGGHYVVHFLRKGTPRYMPTTFNVRRLGRSPEALVMAA